MGSPERRTGETTLAAAIADRQAGFVRAQARWRAVDTRAPGGEVRVGPGRGLPEALLRRALQCLAGPPEYALAHQLLGEGNLVASPDPLTEVSLQALAQAGLATWDPSTGDLRSTALLTALMDFFEAGVEGAVNRVTS